MFTYKCSAFHNKVQNYIHFITQVSIFIFLYTCQKFHENNCCVYSVPHTNTRTHKPCRSVCITIHKAVTEEKEETLISWDDSIVCVVVISKIGHFTHTSLFSYFLWQQTFYFFLLNFFKCLQETFLWISFSIFYMECWLSSGPVFTVTSSSGRLCFKVKFTSKTFSACISQARFPFMKFPSWKKCELL